MEKSGIWRGHNKYRLSIRRNKRTKVLKDLQSEAEVHALIEEPVVLDRYKVVLYRNQPSGWVPEIPSISGCYALMPTPAEALAELEDVFAMIQAEFQELGAVLPADTTEIVHA